MDVDDLKLPKQLLQKYVQLGFKKLRPSQEKAINAGVLEGKNALVCTPTASGKTMVGEFAVAKTILEKGKKGVYIVPLRALGSEKYKEFKERFQGMFSTALSIGDYDSAEKRLGNFDLIIATSERLDSLLRHHTPWIKDVGCVIIDEIHLLNDASRGPTLEILITLLRQIIPQVQLIGLSATVGNAEELADWLDAQLVVDDWRPVTLHKGIYQKGKITFDQ